MLLSSVREGFRRALGAPRLIVALWMVGFLVATPAAWEMTARLDESVSGNRAHEALEGGFDMGWFGEFQGEARGVAATFTPTVTGAGAFYANLEAWITGSLVETPPVLLGLGLLFLMVWILLQGGVVQRLARPGAEPGARRVVEGGARFFLRFLRLAFFSGVAYVLIYLGSRWAYGKIAEVTRDVPAERPTFLLSLGVLALTAFLLVLVQMSFAYAKIATVLQDRRGMLFTAFHGAWFVVRHPVRALGLYIVFALVSLGLLALYAVVAPVAGPGTAAGVIAAFAGGQLYLMVKLAMRLALLGGQAALYRGLTGGA